MDDTTITSIADNHFLQYNATTSVWENLAEPTGVTQTTGDNSTKLATTEYIDSYPVGGVFTGTIGNIQVPNNAITSAMLAEGTIIAQDIAPNAVDGTHIAMGGDVIGDTLYYDGTDYVRLPKGLSGQLLAMGGSDIPEWATLAINTDLIYDTSPQLGGHLDLNGWAIAGTGTIDSTVLGVTQTAGDNSTKLATTAYVDAATSGGGGDCSGYATEGFSVSMSIALG